MKGILRKFYHNGVSATAEQREQSSVDVEIYNYPSSPNLYARIVDLPLAAYSEDYKEPDELILYNTHDFIIHGNAIHVNGFEVVDGIKYFQNWHIAVKTL